MISSKHTVYYAQDKIVAESVNHVTLLTNRYPKLISLPTSIIFVSGTSESVSIFYNFIVSRPFLKNMSVNPENGGIKIDRVT